MKKFIVYLLIFLSVVALALRFTYQPIIKSLHLVPRAGIRIESNQKAKVLIDHQEVGNTPFRDETLSEGKYLVELQPQNEATGSAKASWQGYVKLNAGTLSIVNRELADSKALFSGEVITLEKGSGATVVSTPVGATVSVDGQEIGRAPVTISKLKSGEHLFFVAKDNFSPRSIRASVADNYNLTLNVDLALSELDLTKILTVPITNQAQVVVKQTPTGFLRVREKADLNSAEVGRVNPGEALTLIEEQSGWDKVRLPNGKEGYVSSIYVEKKS